MSGNFDGKYSSISYYLFVHFLQLDDEKSFRKRTIFSPLSLKKIEKVEKEARKYYSTLVIVFFPIFFTLDDGKQLNLGKSILQSFFLFCGFKASQTGKKELL